MEASCFGGRGDVKDGPKARRLRRSRSLTSPLPPKNPHPCARRTGFEGSRHRCASTPRFVARHREDSPARGRVLWLKKTIVADGDNPRGRTMSAPETLDEFDRFLSIECPVERYVSLGLAFEEIIEKLRTKGTEAERQALE